MKKLLVLMMAFLMTLSLAACGGGEDTQEANDTIANTTESATEAADWPYENVTKEQIQALSDVLVELEPLYNQAAALAVENGWEADEVAVEELNTVYVLMDAAKYGVADPREYGDTNAEDMDIVVEQYQVILGAMPDLIAKFSESYGK